MAWSSRQLWWTLGTPPPHWKGAGLGLPEHAEQLSESDQVEATPHSARPHRDLYSERSKIQILPRRV